MNRTKTTLTMFAVIVAGCDAATPVQQDEPPAITQQAEPAATLPEPTTSQVIQSDHGKPDTSLTIIGWNIESGGNDPLVIASQIEKLDCDVLALNEVIERNFELYNQAFQIGSNCKDVSVCIPTGSGRGDKLAIYFDAGRFEFIGTREMNSYRDYQLNDGNHRSPLYVMLKDRQTGFEFIVMTNHLARRSEWLRQRQAAGLREWARDSNIPIIALGDFNFDYSFAKHQGNESFVEFMRDGIWDWIVPEPLIDTQWSDDNGTDRYPDSLLDFAFVANGAKELNARCSVLVTPGDFPDTEQTSDHRPVKLVVELPNDERGP
ncbi:endonuclease/exonuclease/phosphatase family protein [Mariniblastus sp.]|nr:endonuclease/exonuclease/phosphatase family protein [Mariniblastus sp.]